MSKNKSSSLFLHQVDAIVFIIFQIYFTTGVVLKIGEYPPISSSFSWVIFGRDAFRPIVHKQKYLMEYY